MGVQFVGTLYLVDRELAKKSPCRCVCLYTQQCLLTGRVGCNQVKEAQEGKGAREAPRKEGRKHGLGENS